MDENVCPLERKLVVQGWTLVPPFFLLWCYFLCILILYMFCTVFNLYSLDIKT